MTKDDAIAVAEEFVKRRYPKVPEVVMVSHLAGRLERMFVKSWFKRPGSARWRESAMWVDEAVAEESGVGDAWRAASAAEGREWGAMESWTVHFFMSWDTDEVGMPPTLAIRIDGAGGQVTEMAGERVPDEPL